MATYPGTQYGTPPFVDPKYWEDEEEQNPFSLSKIAARKPFQMASAFPADPGLKPPYASPTGLYGAPPPRPAAEPMGGGYDPQERTMPVDEGMGAGLPGVPAGSATPAMPRSMKQDDWISAPNPILSDWNTAAARRDEFYKTKPKLHDKEYDLPGWQKALMMGTNAAAGFVNAGGRSRVAPIDAQTLRRRPKYEAAMDLWETKGKAIDSELASIQAKYGLQRQANQDDLANRQFKRQQEVSQAQIEETLAQAEQRRKLANAPQKPFADRWGTINPETGEYYKPPSWALPQQKEPVHHNVTAEDKYFTGTPEEKVRAESLLVLKNQRNDPTAVTGSAQLTDDRVRELAAQAYNQAQGKREEEEENYGINGKPSLIDRSLELGQSLKPPEGASAEELKKWQPDPGVVQEFIAVQNRLKTIYGRRFSRKEISREQYDSMIQGINANIARLSGDNTAGAAKPAPTQQAAPAAAPTDNRSYFQQGLDAIRGQKGPPGKQRPSLDDPKYRKPAP